jgi:hypothetical protein
MINININNYKNYTTKDSTFIKASAANVAIRIYRLGVEHFQQS